MIDHCIVVCAVVVICAVVVVLTCVMWYMQWLNTVNIGDYKDVHLQGSDKCSRRKLIAKSIKDAKRLVEHFWKQRDEVFADSIKQTS